MLNSELSQDPDARLLRVVDRRCCIPKSFLLCGDYLLRFPGLLSIHGQFFGQNILLRRRGGARQIAVIDWETAARGPGAFDLVSLTAGKWTSAQRRAMWVAYFEEYRAATGQRLDWAEFRRELATVALHQSLEWLTWWQHRRSLSRDFARFMKELDSVLDEHFASG